MAELIPTKAKEIVDNYFPGKFGNDKIVGKTADGSNVLLRHFQYSPKSSDNFIIPIHVTYMPKSLKSSA